MCVRHPGFEFLLWFSAVLLVSAQSAEQACLPPVLDNGFVLPQETEYAHNETITYSCDIRQKPAVEGWWATVTCVNGKWSPKPECIDESSCFPPDNVPNTKYSQSSTGWFRNSEKIKITCDEGYKTQNNSLNAQCVNGAWAPLPVCERHKDSCSEPPQLPHAVIINQKYQEVFAEGSVVEYQCEDGYTTEQGHKKSVYCLAGTWTEGPTCKQPDSGPFIPVSNCGRFPNVPHSKVERINSVSLKYSCVAPYKLSGLENVVCHSDGTWSDLPTCKAEGHCVLDPQQYLHGYWIHEYTGENVPDGETIYRHCSSDRSYTRAVKCNDGRLTVAQHCCEHKQSVKDQCW